MKVLHLVKTSVGATWAFRQMRELVKMGVEVHVALPTDGPLIPKYLEHGIIVHELSYSLKSIIATSRNLRSVVREVKPDIIHSHFVITTVIMRLALRRINTPRIFQVPGPLHLENPFYRKGEILLAQKNDFWVGSCKWTNNTYERAGIDKSRIFLSYYGGDLLESNSPGGALRKELGLSDTAIIAGMVAFMYAPKWYLGQRRGLKGHEDFIDAISLLQHKYPELTGVCIGGPWAGALKYEQQIKQYSQKKKARVFFLGTRNNIFELYKDIDIAVHPSLSENLGGAPESMFNMVITIATNIGGFPDIVKDKETGFLVKPHDPAGIADAIEGIINNRYDLGEIRARGKTIAMELLDVKASSKTIFEVYKTILSRT